MWADSGLGVVVAFKVHVGSSLAGERLSGASVISVVRVFVHPIANWTLPVDLVLG